MITKEKGLIERFFPLFLRFLYAFHNKDFRLAFQKTLNRYFICCRQRRTSTSSANPLPPATPSGDNQRTGSKKQKGRNKKSKTRSKTTITDEEKITTNNKLILDNNGIDTPNGNLTGGENSISSKHNSCL